MVLGNLYARLRVQLGVVRVMLAVTENSGDAETGKTFFRDCFLLILAVLLCLLSKIFSPVLLKHLITSDDVYNAVIRYLDWRIWGLLFFPFLALRSFLVGITDKSSEHGSFHCHCW